MIERGDSPALSSVASVTGPDDSLHGATSAIVLRDWSEPLRKPPTTRYAAIDIGTNSIHMVIAEISPEGDFRIIDSDKDMVRLGRGGFGRSVLTPQAMDAGIETLRRYRRMAELKKCNKIKAVATSAVREARNGGEFVARAWDELALEINVISIEEEARLVYLGVRHAVDLGQQNSLILDIGGGSIEMIVGNAIEARKLVSAKLGGSRLAELFLRSDPPRPEEMKALRRHVSDTLDPLLKRLKVFSVERCIGTAGTIRNLAIMCGYRRGQQSESVNATYRMTRDELKALAGDLQGKTREQRLQFPGMDARRVDYCLPAAGVLLPIMKAMKVGEIGYCDYALREGMIVDYIGRHRRKLLARATWPDPRTRSIIYLAERCNYHRRHAEQVARLADQLFDELAPQHQLDPAYRELLHYAALLHDIGYHISPRGHHKHSYYLISNGELRGFDEQEIEIIANLARYHRKERPKKTHFSFQQLAAEHQRPVRKLSVLLRMAEALDRTHSVVVDRLTCRLRGKTLQLHVYARRDAELEIWTARRQGHRFEREFGCPLDIHVTQTQPAESDAEKDDNHG